MQRPRVFIPARFSARASALRFAALATARALAEAVYLAGGEPLSFLPWAPNGKIDETELADRLREADAVLLPGGGDLHPQWYGEAEHPTLYDVDVEQDAVDLACARHCVARGVPLLGICRGLHVLTVALGGSLVVDMAEEAHRHREHDVTVEPASRLGQIVTQPSMRVSCFHHQCVARPGRGLRPVAWAVDGTPEAFELSGEAGWCLGIQWHPEDGTPSDQAQMAIFKAFMDAACRFATQDGRR